MIRDMEWGITDIHILIYARNIEKNVAHVLMTFSSCEIADVIPMKYYWLENSKVENEPIVHWSLIPWCPPFPPLVTDLVMVVVY